MKKTLAGLLLIWSASAASAGDAKIAVAANFTEPATEIVKLFTEKTGHTATLSFGSSGQFYTQITQGAPFEVFLSADAARPAKAVEDGFGVPGTVFTYAIGTLVLWSKDPALVAGPETLKAAAFDHIALADPKSAPYGAAAIETMQALGVYDALAQVIKIEGGSRWDVPADLHTPIRQDAVLLKTGAENAAAKAFLDFLKGPEARKVIESYGYALAPELEGASG